MQWEGPTWEFYDLSKEKHPNPRKLRPEGEEKIKGERALKIRCRSSLKSKQEEEEEEEL